MEAKRNRKRVGRRDRRRTYLEHLVGGGLDAGHHVRGREGQLLHLGEVVGGVAVEHHSSDLLEGIVLVRPDLSQVEGVEGGGLEGGCEGGREGRVGGAIGGREETWESFGRAPQEWHGERRRERGKVGGRKGEREG